MVKNRVTKKCIVCNKLFLVKKCRENTAICCSRKCIDIYKIGHRPTNYNGGKLKHKGYIYILSKNHPNADRDGYETEHRLVMEKHLGRYLTKDEIVHHKNNDRSDNRIENLELMESQSEHMSKHYPKGLNFVQRKLLVKNLIQ
jgi:hypothetical protein